MEELNAIVEQLKLSRSESERLEQVYLDAVKNDIPFPIMFALSKIVL